ncbi:hypothetical protein ACFVH0_26370 [Streptomyces sp. NPDC127117]|uniref:hypothetical protein n=1 Tax=Streptomyces sp. NPDC127117 TaxID=3345368 RepID=UPI003627C3C8
MEKILVSEPSTDRRAIIAGPGASVVDPVNENLAAAVAVDAAGAAVTAAPAGLVPGGRLVVAALHEHPMKFRPKQLMATGTETVGAVGHRPAGFDAVFAETAEGVYDTSGWVRGLPLEGVTDALQTLRSGAGAKTLIQVGRSPPNGPVRVASRFRVARTGPWHAGRPRANGGGRTLILQRSAVPRAATHAGRLIRRRNHAALRKESRWPSTIRDRRSTRSLRLCSWSLQIRFPRP